MPPKKSVKSSSIWNFFVDKPNSDKLAICNICKNELSYKSTSNNLKKHIQKKHPLVKLDQDNTRSDVLQNPEQDDADEPGPSGAVAAPVTASLPTPTNTVLTPVVSNSNLGASTQTTVNMFLKKKVGIHAKKKN